MPDLMIDAHLEIVEAVANSNRTNLFARAMLQSSPDIRGTKCGWGLGRPTIRACGPRSPCCLADPIVPIDRATYVRVGVSLMLLKYVVDAVLSGVFAGVFWTPVDYVLPMIS